MWQEQWQKNSAGGVVGDDCTDGIVAAEVEVAAVGVVRGDGDGRGLAWLGWVASFLLLLGALVQLEEQHAVNRVRVKNSSAESGLKGLN